MCWRRHLRGVVVGLGLVLAHAAPTRAQVLYTESFAVILDSTRRVKGAIQPDVSWRNLRDNLLEIENRVNITFRRERHAWTFANQVEYTRLGREDVLSGGYLFGEFRDLNDNRYVTEVYAELHWQSPRGLRRKVAGGYNARLRLRKEPTSAAFLGLGLFYEYEEWTYRGVPDGRRPEIVPALTITRRVKANAYASLKQGLTEDIFLDVSGYVQAPLNGDLTRPRLALSAQVRYQIRTYLAFQLGYRNLYDQAPVVPVDKLFNRFDFGISLQF